jgi:hypothetical protein
MGLIDRIIEAHGRWGVRAYNQLRLVFTILAPAFIILGIAELFGLGTLYVNGETVTGVGRTISSVFDIGLGLSFGYLRVTVFREKRYHEANGT